MRGKQYRVPLSMLEVRYLSEVWRYDFIIK